MYQHSTKADWLDVTYSPNDSPFPDFRVFLLGCMFGAVNTIDSGKFIFRSPDLRGVIKISESSKFVRFSISGACIDHLISLGAWDECLSILASSPHNITRLDICLDVECDGADLVQSMRDMCTAGHVNLGRKSISTAVILSTRGDGRETGTWYAGRGSSSRLTARVYDKAYQMLQRHNLVIPGRGRIELTFSKYPGITLRDASVTDPLFYHGASPALIVKPDSVPSWVPCEYDYSWSRVLDPPTPSQVIKRRLEHSAEFESLVSLAVTFTGGLAYMQSLVSARISYLAEKLLDDLAESD